MSTIFSKNNALMAYLPMGNLNSFIQSNKQHLASLDRYLREHLSVSNLLKVFGASVAGVSLIYLIKVWWAHQFFKRRGIKTPKFRFFVGNFPTIRKQNYSETLKQWTNELGPIYGYFEGHLPVLVTTDLEIIQEVFIKQYSNFSARKTGPLARKDNDPSMNLFSSSRSRWKRMRNVMNPTFSSAKLKDLSPLMIKCIDRLDLKLAENENMEINISEYFKRFTMDTIWNCAFGLDINLQFDKSHDEYYQKCEKVFQDALKFPFIFYLSTYFYEFKPSFVSLLVLISKASKLLSNSSAPNGFLWLSEKVYEIVEDRQKSKISRNDYLNLLLEAHTTNDMADVNKNENTFISTHMEKKLTMSEIKLNLVLFMLAGYETTSTTLTYASYILARYPYEQETLYNDIINHFPEDSNVEPEIDTVSKCEYLNMFVKEVLRMYPIATSIISRRCTNATKIKGIDISEDMIIAADVLTIHYDQELWGPVDPHEFYPKRHLPECKRNPLAFMSFGLGPRNCIGMKFAYQELKFALVKLLRKYEVLPGPNTPMKLEIVEGAVRSPKGGVNVIFKKRNPNSN